MAEEGLVAALGDVVRQLFTEGRLADAGLADHNDRGGTSGLAPQAERLLWARRTAALERSRSRRSRPSPHLAASGSTSHPGRPAGLDVARGVASDKVHRSPCRATRGSRFLPVRIKSFLKDFGALDVQRAKAMLQPILKTVHVYNDGRIELEFREQQTS